MNIDEKQYNLCVGFAKKLTRTSPHVSADDIVGDVLMDSLLMGEMFDIEILKKRIRNRFLIESLNNKKHSGNPKFSRNETDKLCKCCGDIKPVAAFYLLNDNKNNTQQLSHHCIDCMRKKWRERNKTVAGREICRKRFSEWVSLHNEKWKRYNNDRYRNGKKELSDAYIRKLLRHKYGTEYLLSHPEVVEEKRRKLILKSQKKRVV